MANRVLIIGYGNPGRLDDGLGPAFAAALQELNLPGVTVDSDYQLTVEDAEQAAHYDAIIFVDAAVRGPEPFALRAVKPTSEASFSTHSVEPGAVLTLAEQLFGGRPAAYALAIRGYAFNGFGEQLTPAAHRNLAAALSFMQDSLRQGGFKPARELDPELEPTARGAAAGNRTVELAATEDANRLN